MEDQRKDVRGTHDYLELNGNWPKETVTELDADGDTDPDCDRASERKMEDQREDVEGTEDDFKERRIIWADLRKFGRDTSPSTAYLIEWDPKDKYAPSWNKKSDTNKPVIEEWAERTARCADRKHAPPEPKLIAKQILFDKYYKKNDLTGRRKTNHYYLVEWEDRDILYSWVNDAQYGKLSDAVKAAYKARTDKWSDYEGPKL
jgi:hypothetical protein